MLPSSLPTRLIVVGSANVDLCMNLPELPGPGETLGSGVFRQTFGGKGANAAVAAAQAGGDVALIGCVGQDSNGEAMLANLRAKNVDISHIEKHPTAPTGVAFIFIDQHAQNMIGVAAGSNDGVSPERLEAMRGELGRASVILVQNEGPDKTVFHLLEMAREGSWKILYNCAPARLVPLPLLAIVEWLILNESEAAFISGNGVATLPEAETAARAILQLGVKNVLITLGAEGVWVAQADQCLHVPAYKVKAVDTVAAGDIFCGALAVACAEGRELADAVRFASAAAAISVTRPGAQNAAPSRGEIETLLQVHAT